MQFGLIGENLRHSFSKELHKKIGNYPYELCEMPCRALQEFFTRRNFRAVNVTIPYKEAVLPYLHRVSDIAKRIGAVNLVCNEKGVLCGYNTDYFGAKRMIERANVQIAGKKVLLLGTGGTSRTLRCVLTDLHAREIVAVSRTKSDCAVTYREAEKTHADAEIIVNTTPVGTYPAVDDIPIDVDAFPDLCGVVDVIYNPLTTRLKEKALQRNLPVTDGLFMLVAQAVQSFAIVSQRPFDEELCESVYKSVLKEKQNVVLIGMPSSGKSTIGKTLAKTTGKPFFDTDELIQARTQKSVSEIFSRFGEADFRKEEHEAIKALAPNTGAVIATGGGAIKNPENLRLLKKNGKLFFLDRPLSLLAGSDDRPLSKNTEDLRRLYEERYPLYSSAADVHLENDGSIDSAVRKILQSF